MSNNSPRGSLKIRNGNKDDLVYLVQLADQADTTRLKLFPAIKPRGQEKYRKALDKFNRDDFWIKVVTTKDKIIGFISGESTIDLKSNAKIIGSVHIKTMIVDPKYWGRGIGKVLIDEAIKLLKKRGITKSELWTQETNIRAKKLYESRGFKLTGEVKESENTNERVVRYSLDI